MTSVQPPISRNAPDKIGAARLSVVSNILLVALKLGVGLSIGSVAVLSEAAHSATDLLAALIAFFAVRAADAPPDRRHPYGHGKVESASGVAEAALILLAGAVVIYEATRAILHPGHGTENLRWGIAVMLLSGIVNFFLSRHLLLVARQTDSIALEADAHHLRVDVWTSFAVVAGLVLVAVTGQRLLDPLVALAVGALILATGWKVLRGAFFPLLDERLPESEMRQIEQVLNGYPDLRGWHKLRTRKAGSVRHIDVHILLDDDLSLRDAHRITEDLEDCLRAAWPNVEVMVHTEPYEEETQHQKDVPHRTLR